MSTDKNVYILGAGFSKELNIPLQDDFLLVAKEVYFKNQSKYKYFEKVFEHQDQLTKMRKFLNYPLLNLESLFNLIEMNIFYSKEELIEDIKSKFIKLIEDVISETTPIPFYNDQNGKFRTNRDIYSNYIGFLKLIRNKNDSGNFTQSDSIISFNYDLALEHAAVLFNYEISEKRNIHDSNNKDMIFFNVGFGKTNINVKRISNYVQGKGVYTGHYPTVNCYSDTSESIKLLKLHGSVNWKTEDNNTFIVPPTWNKSDDRIRLLWETAYKELIHAKRIIVIGYSFPETDIYVKSLIALALNEDKILQKICFINPDTEKVKSSSLSLLDGHFVKYCQYKPWPFKDLINSQDGREFISNELNR